MNQILNIKLMHTPHMPALGRDENLLDEPGAYKLAAKIRNVWALRGLAPVVSVSKLMSSASPTDGERAIYIVRSDMRNGRPV